MCTFKHALCNKHSSISRSDRKKLLLQKNYKETNMACYHFAELVYRQAEKYGNRTAIKYRDEATGKWLKVSWNEFAEQITLTAEAMADCGMQVQENIGVYSQNMPQCLYTYFGAYANRIVDIPMYATSSPAQIAFIVEDAQIHTLFVGEQLQYNNAYIVQKQLPNILKRLVVFDSNVRLNPEDKTSVYFEDFIRLGNNAHAESMVKVRSSQAMPSDVATIIYTSGTTGRSKGVILTHANYLEAIRVHNLRIPQVTDKDLSMCFLPLTHIFERGWTMVCISKGCPVAINLDPKKIQQTLPEVCPTVMCNVPRFWEKVYIGIQEKIKTSSPTMQKVFLNAIEVGHDYIFNYKRLGKKAPLALKAKFEFYDRTVFTLLKHVLGIKRGKFFPVAGAPLADKVLEFLMSVNIPIRYGYGLSETTATVSFFPEENYEIGSLGMIQPGLEVKIDPSNNEILVKGKTVMAGYYNRSEENAKAFTEDGFFRTGDAGRINGNILYFSERIKDLYKTSNGKYIAPQAIELSLTSDPYIEQVAIIGDQRKFVSALIVPNIHLLENYAKSHNISYNDTNELVKNEYIHKLMQSHIEEHQKELAAYEKVKRFTLLAEPFSIASGELTDTLKLRRRVVAEHYAKEIEAMYVE